MSGDNGQPVVRRFESSGGAEIFQIPLLAFPRLWGYAYLVLFESKKQRYRVLIDAGSGFGDSNQHLEEGLKQAAEMAGQGVSWEDLTHIFITHGHIDHFGGLTYVRPRTSASLGVHELDLRNLANYEERLTVVARLLRDYLVDAGVPEEQREGMLENYLLTKRLYTSVQVDFTYEAVGMQVGPFKMLHVPGHCAGHVVIRLHDVLFSGDHVLNDISPHQSPEQLTLSTGVDHYLKSLEQLRPWANGVRLTLGGHKQPVVDLEARIREIRRVHRERLEKILVLLSTPHTIHEISEALFGDVSGYTVLLALEEAGAHVEYLYQRGLLAIENLDELENSRKPAAIYYRCLPCGVEDLEKVLRQI